MLQRAIRLRAAIGCTMLLAASSCASESESATAVSRNFDELARAVASCAGVYRSCKDAGVGVGAGAACLAAFRDCRSRMGADAQDELAVAIASCEDHAGTCTQKAPAPEPALNGRCAQSLRACVGEASDREITNPSRDYTRPNPYASTYQCFGQLQECVAAASSPTKCAASARTCVIDSVGEPPMRSTTLLDAGTRSPDAGSTIGASGARNLAGADAAQRGAMPP
jgi:hypothetical protein